MKYKNITIQENFDLSSRVGMKLAGTARFYTEVGNRDELLDALSWSNENQQQIYILGGGSNLLVGETGIDALVVSMNFLGREIVFEDDEFVDVHIAAGENWDETVAWAVEHHWWGIENLSHIPGKVGAFVVQNVGAYGQEASQVVQSVEVFNIEKNDFETLGVDECGFDYRKSIFNDEKKGKYIILSMVLKLQKNGQPKISYPDVTKYFEQHGILSPSIQQVRTAIISIRDAKLPLPETIGNNGSFFKNLLLDEKQFELLKDHCVEHFDQDMIEQLDYFSSHYTRNGKTKIPTAYLIEQCGLKGHAVGGAQVSQQHALVILNPDGNATFNDVQQLIEYIREVVLQKCGVWLEIEPEVVGYDFKNVK